ncbi:hypothetical protein [Arundinibacter roseus]|uniref:Uncharacterized protein n=1 Tax=Arundinibacter roseus TaxID=2070510 RepID=A0A4V2XAM0_9BACT|nr:hypothetical protein [Arundinibacter roseus]TDB68255.1 hypothetical protein EZE20_04875 [Arundinibacter roseus]
MRNYLIFSLFILSFTPLFAQDHYDPAKALSSEELFLKQNQNNRVFLKADQNYLILDASTMVGGYHRQRFFPGDNIRFTLRGESTRFEEEIYSVSDSSFTFVLINEAAGKMEYREVMLRDIHKVKTFRRIPWITEGAFLLPLAGLTYIGADFFNRGIDNQRFTTDRQTLLVGGSMMAAGFVFYKISFSTIKMKGANRIRVLQTY